MINLLPPSYKKEFSQEENFRLLVILGVSFGVFLICLALMLLTIRIYLSGQIQSEKFLSTPSAKELQASTKASQDVKKANSNFSTLLLVYQNRLSPSAIFDYLSKNLPPDISLETLNISSSGVLLEGFSPTRDTLFAFREKLAQDSPFENIDFPISNLVKSQDIHFVIRMSIRKTQ